jgi:hypothetical protein
VSEWGDAGFAGLIAGGYLALLTLTWASLAFGAGRWGRRWRLTSGQRAPDNAPRLSVCIPARDEAGRIGPAVRAALALDYPNLEVVVVDDRSSDGTGQEARDAGAGDERLRVILGTEPPAGWAGKPWACLRAAGEATGELLLFVDADVQVAPWSAGAAVSAMETENLDLLSLFGDWELRSFWERAVIPVVGWFIRGSVDLDGVNDQARQEAFANGQFILVRTQGYEAVDGHAAVRAEVLDDVRLARAFKSRGLRTGIRHAPGAFSVRLYTGLGDIVAGYGKNLYEGMDRRPIIAWGAILFVVVSTLSPYVVLAALGVGVATGAWSPPRLGWWLWLAAIVGLIHLFRFRLERADGRSGVHSLTHPLGNVVLVWVLLRSFFGMRAQWKGRAFVDGKAGSPE